MSEDTKDTKPKANPSAVSIEQRDQLIEVLESLEDMTRRQISLKFVFLRGAVYGLGTVIGATVLISVVSFIAVQFFGNVVAEEEVVENRINSLLNREAEFTPNTANE